MEKGWSAAGDDVKNWLKDYGKALEEWRKGTECSQACYHPPREMYFGTLLPVTQELRVLTRMAHCEAARYEAEKNWAEVLRWQMAGLRCSRHTGLRGCVIERMVSSSIHHIATQRLLHWAEHIELTSEQLRAALKEIQAAGRLSVPLSDAIKAEFVMMNNTLDRSDWLTQCELTSGSAAEEPWVNGQKALFWLIGEPSSTRLVLRQLAANQLSQADLPRPELHLAAVSSNTLLYEIDAQTASQKRLLTPVGIDRALKRSAVTKAVVGFRMKELHTKILEERSHQATTETAFAAQAYERDHGEFPESLTNLVPVYLETVPTDPFDVDGSPIRYRRESPNSALIWTIGSDGKNQEVDAALARSVGFGVELKTR